MPLTTVNPNSTDIEHLASVDVEFSGTHIGGGIYLATNHNPNTDGRVRTAMRGAVRRMRTRIRLLAQL